MSQQLSTRDSWPRTRFRFPGRVVAVTLFRRPTYTRRVIEALQACNGIDHYLVVFHVEPGSPAVRDLARYAELAHTIVIENRERLGCGANTWSALEHAFRYANFVVLLEDDSVPARDCLQYFEWACNAYRSDPTVFSVSAYTRNRPAPNAYYGAIRVPWFNSWGWGTWVDRWQEMRVHWGVDGSESWDIRMNRLRGDRVQIQPLLARTQNIGAEDGQHVPSAQWHREHQFNEFGAWSVDLTAFATFTEHPG